MNFVSIKSGLNWFKTSGLTLGVGLCVVGAFVFACATPDSVLTCSQAETVEEDDSEIVIPDLGGDDEDGDDEDGGDSDSEIIIPDLGGGDEDGGDSDSEIIIPDLGGDDEDSSDEDGDDSEPKSDSAPASETSSVPASSDAAKVSAQPSLWPLELLIPAESAVIVRFSSIRDLNTRFESLTETNFLRLLKTLGKGEYARQLQPDFPAAVVLFPSRNTFQWAAMVPVRHYREFASLLGADVSSLPKEIPDGTVSVISDTICVAPYRNHALLAANPMVLSWIQRSPKFGETCRFTPCAVKSPTISVEFTNVLIRFLVQRGRIGLEEFAPVFTPEMLGIQDGSEQMALARQYFDRVNDSISWLNENVESARIDLTVGETESILSTAFLPKQGTRLAELIRDPYLPQICTTLDGRDFLKVVPAHPSPLFGQVDIPPATAERLEAPFNRIRHVEYTLTTPPADGRLAEAWCFFLEVNDSEAFVKEMLIPRAKEVGGQFGANTMGEIGSEMAQRAAERRQERQLSRRRPPKRLADPAKAAERGGAIGSMLGGLIGESVAVNEAMKKHDFMGHDLYISDLIQFTQLKKRIQEQQEGIAPKVQLMADGARPSQMIGMLIQGLITGDTNLRMEEVLGGGLMSGLKEENPVDPPLAAARNFIVVLDANHLLVVPGNDVVLYEAVQRWHTMRGQWLPPEPPLTNEQIAERQKLPPYIPAYQTEPPQIPVERDLAWRTGWDAVCNAIAVPAAHQVRLASVITPEEALKTAEFAGGIYGFEVPQNVKDLHPETVPALLSVYSTTGVTGCTFLTLPHEISRAQFQKVLVNLPVLLAKPR